MSQETVLTQRLECVEKEVAQLKQRLDQLAPHPEFSEFEAAEHPLVPFAGMLRDDPMLDAWKQVMAENRRKLDEAEGLP